MAFNTFSRCTKFGENQQNRLPPHQLLPVHAKVTLHTPQHQSLNNSIHALNTTLALGGEEERGGRRGGGGGAGERGGRRHQHYL